MATTSSLWSTSIEVGAFSTSDRWASCPLSTLETALNNTAYVPANATVTKVVLKVTASWWCGGGASSNGYIKYGFGGTSSISKELLGKTKIEGGANENNVYDYPSGGVDITTLLSNKVAQSVALTRSYGDYLTFCFQSSNNLKKRFHVKSVILDITYHTHSYTTVISETPATCTTAGSRTKQCSCGQTTIETIPATGHTQGTAVVENKVEATCTAKGSYDEVTYCSVCGVEILRVKKEIPQKEHSYTTQKVDPTGDLPGYTRHICSCGDYYDTDFTYRITANASPIQGGTVSGGGIYNSGASVRLTATPNDGWMVSCWEKDGVEISLSEGEQYIDVEATENTAYTVVFQRTVCVVATATQPEGAGTVSGGGTYSTDTQIELLAIPEVGFKLVDWIIYNEDSDETYNLE